MWRLISNIVPSGLLIACLLAGSPTRSWPSRVNATTDGNIFPATVGPSALGIIVGLPPMITAAAEFVVPRSIPDVISCLPLLIFQHISSHKTWIYHQNTIVNVENQTKEDKKY